MAAFIALPGSWAQGEPAPATGHYTTAETTVGVLLDDPAARAVVDKFIPEFSTSKRITLVRGLTLRTLQRVAPDKVTDESLKSIDAELARLPAK